MPVANSVNSRLWRRQRANYFAYCPTRRCGLITEDDGPAALRALWMERKMVFRVAMAGATGNVNAPQLHFEVRKGATPVDPMQYLQGG